MICPKCKNERFFTYGRIKIICGNCGNLIDYPKVEKEVKEEFVDVEDII